MNGTVSYRGTGGRWTTTYPLCCCGTEAPTHARLGHSRAAGLPAVGAAEGCSTPQPLLPLHTHTHTAGHPHTRHTRDSLPRPDHGGGHRHAGADEAAAGVTSSGALRCLQHTPHATHTHTHTRQHASSGSSNTRQRLAAEKRQKYEAGALRPSTTHRGDSDAPSCLHHCPGHTAAAASGHHLRRSPRQPPAPAGQASAHHTPPTAAPTRAAAALAQGCACSRGRVMGTKSESREGGDGS